MNKTLTFSLLACLILVGCSQTPSKDAPIEERGGAAVSTAAGAVGQGGEGQAGAGVTQAGLGQGGVETHALPGGQMTGTDASASGMAAAAGGKYPRKDPGSILSKRTIYFDFDSSAIRDEFRPIIEAHAQFLKENKEAKAILQGHTDERGSREYNIALGQRRAESVSQATALLGVPEGQVEAVSLGEEKPIAEGHDEAAWQQNRRVEILYQGE